MIRTLVVVWCLMAQALAAQQSDIEIRIERAFDAWLLEVDAQNGVLIAQKDGQTPLTVARGWTADEPVGLASLSKSITALCTAALIREGALTADTTSLAVLGYGAEGITVADLLTHSSGLGPDETQTFMYLWLDTAKSAAGLVSKRALTRDAQTQTQGGYHYNNENYAILGQMIASVTGQSYRAACTERVIEPAGATSATASKRTGSTLPWGGWEMSVDDYARILAWGYGVDGIAGNSPQDWPTTALSDQVDYGLGMFQRSAEQGTSFWHFGSWCFPFRFKTGAYAVSWYNGWRIVAAYDVCLEEPQMGALDRALGQAVFP